MGDAGGFRDPAARLLFAHGYQALVAQVQPALVLIYGRLPVDLQALAPFREYPVQWHGIWAAKRLVRDP